MELVEMKQDFLNRSVNAGFSGGEKKRNEILQMAVMQPKLAMLDETDSGLDIDALRVVASGVNALRGPERSMIVITHYQRLLDYIKPDFVHVLVDGRIVESGRSHAGAAPRGPGLRRLPGSGCRALNGRPRHEPFAAPSWQHPPTRSDQVDRLDSIACPPSATKPGGMRPTVKLAQFTFGPSEWPVDEVLGFELDAQIPALDGPRLVLVNGVVDTARSDLGALPDGVVFVSLAELASEATARLGQTHERPDDAFSIINRAYATGGAVVQITGQVRVPLHVVDVSVPGDAHNASASRVVIDLAAGASATVVETRIGSTDRFGGSNVRTEIILGVEASLEHIILQDLPAAQLHIGRVEVEQAASSTLRARLFNLGADYGRVAYHVRLTGEGARAELSGLYFGFGDQTLDQQITVVHEAKDCTSRQSYRGVLDDSSTGIWNGCVDVRPGADGTDSEQSNDNLLLSRTADVNTMPRLEIFADEVSCQHGATVGQLDDAALYYLRSRGIRKDEASRLLINGFADQVMDDLDHDAVRAWVTARLGHDHG
jgi:Fe-S cluster assembly protein SufD